MADIQRYRSNGLLLPDGSMRYGDVAHYDDHIAALSTEREQTERYRQMSILLAATNEQLEQENKDLRERLAGAEREISRMKPVADAGIALNDHLCLVAGSPGWLDLRGEDLERNLHDECAKYHGESLTADLVGDNEQFEAYLRSKGCAFTKAQHSKTHDYEPLSVQCVWEGWQAKGNCAIQQSALQQLADEGQSRGEYEPR